MRKSLLSIIFFLCCFQVLHAQLVKPVMADSIFGTYYHQRVSLFRSSPQTKGDILFAGNSITDGGEWGELFNDLHVKNRGISGDISMGVIHRIDEITKRKPAKVFMLIGINDLARNITPDSLVKNLLWMADYIKQESPATQVYLQSILPVNTLYGKFVTHTNKGEQILQVNEQLKQHATAHHYTFLNLFEHFADENGKLKADLSNDGLHLTGTGYLLWKHIVYPYVFDLQEKPSLLPLPQQLSWKPGNFPLYACNTIVAKDPLLQQESIRLQQSLAALGLNASIQQTAANNSPFIELALGVVTASQNAAEAYQLTVSEQQIKLTANNTKGIFYGLQTLAQLMRDRTMVQACDIKDWPSFSWRGYMIDVGRNYMSVPLLKQQIDIMSHYKMNIFHFHATEDIAWRFASKKYPELNAPESMLRNKGMYYSEDELKELIVYCKERHIILVPEIDMPGHSAAFKRAMHTDMQSDSGLAIIKNILQEFITTYDLPYLHIGADEVKITNKDFIPAVTAFIESFGKKVIGWQPGGNFKNTTLRQLWLEDNSLSKNQDSIQYIDSRHLYLNHMDPLESVVTIFNRKIGNVSLGNNTVLGGTICMWHDRSVAKEDDILRMNPVVPAMLTFAERSWRGGGKSGWTATIAPPASPGTADFIAFENRLLDQQQLHFTTLPFPYAKQGNMNWKLYGPYDNAGDLTQTFAPEKVGFDGSKTQPSATITGGTIVLRHWWANVVKGVLETPTENSTWYATTQIWSDEADNKKFWIGFNNLSRSYSTDSPPIDRWDMKESAVWVNGEKILPPHWKRAGQNGQPDIPLMDEGYEYRTPCNIALKKGWNTVLVKAPVGSFKMTKSQNPVKWMFTFCEAPAVY